MARISTYAVSSPAKLTDELLGSDINSATKNFTVQSIIDLTGITAGTDNTLAMFGPGPTLVDSPVSLEDGVTKVKSPFQASGETRFKDTVDIEGDTTIWGDFRTKAAVNLESNVKVYGDFRVTEDSTFENYAIFKDTVRIEDVTTLEDKLYVKDVARFEDDVDVIGTFRAKGEARFEEAVTVDGATVIKGDFNVTGDTTLGNAQGVTPEAGDNSTNIATTGFVKHAIDQVPTGLQFQGIWDANTNNPNISESADLENGQYWIVTIEGNTNLDGITDWKVGDWAIYNNSSEYSGWLKIDNTSVLSGGGTSGRIPLLSGPNTLGDSIIKQTGTSSITINDQNGNDVLFTSRTKVASNVDFEAPEINTDLIYGNYSTSSGLELRGRKSSVAPKLVLPSTGAGPAFLLGQGASFGINTYTPSYDLDIQSRSETGSTTRVGIGPTGLITSSDGNVTLDCKRSTLNPVDPSVRLAILGENVLSVLENKTVSIASIGVGNNMPLLTVNGGVKIGDSFQGSGGTAEATHAGSLRYFEGPNASRIQVAMKTGANPNTYEWIDIQVQNY